MFSPFHLLIALLGPLLNSDIIYNTSCGCKDYSNISWKKWHSWHWNILDLQRKEKNNIRHKQYNKHSTTQYSTDMNKNNRIFLLGEEKGQHRIRVTQSIFYRFLIKKSFKKSSYNPPQHAHKHSKVYAHTCVFKNLPINPGNLLQIFHMYTYTFAYLCRQRFKNLKNF